MAGFLKFNFDILCLNCYYLDMLFYETIEFKIHSYYSFCMGFAYCSLLHLTRYKGIKFFYLYIYLQQLYKNYIKII